MPPHQSHHLPPRPILARCTAASARALADRLDALSASRARLARLRSSERDASSRLPRGIRLPTGIPSCSCSAPGCRTAALIQPLRLLPTDTFPTTASKRLKKRATAEYRRKANASECPKAHQSLPQAKSSALKKEGDKIAHRATAPDTIRIEIVHRFSLRSIRKLIRFGVDI